MTTIPSPDRGIAVSCPGGGGGTSPNQLPINTTPSPRQLSHHRILPNHAKIIAFVGVKIQGILGRYLWPLSWPSYSSNKYQNQVCMRSSFPNPVGANAKIWIRRYPGVLQSRGRSGPQRSGSYGIRLRRRSPSFLSAKDSAPGSRIIYALVSPRPGQAT